MADPPPTDGSNLDAGTLSASLVGTWVGSGEGDYPTIEPFTYAETVSIAAVPGKPFLTYTQRTSHPLSGAPMHTETGFLRLGVPTPPGVEFVVAQPTGVTECHTGNATIDEDGTVVIELASSAIGTTPTAKEVIAVRRRLRVGDDTLGYELWMAAVGQPDTLHLRAELHCQPPATGDSTADAPPS